MKVRPRSSVPASDEHARYQNRCWPVSRIANVSLSLSGRRAPWRVAFKLTFQAHRYVHDTDPSYLTSQLQRVADMHLVGGCFICRPLNAWIFATRVSRRG